MKRLFFVLALAACDVRVPRETPELGLERMIDQPRVGAYDPSALGGPQRPPEGTVVAGDDVDLVRARGKDGDAFLAAIPVPLTPALLARGRDRFDVVCATCHGITGTGASVVAEKMAFRRPPSLHEPRVKAYPPGQLYGIVKDGYGLMPAYGAVLTTDDRWAVVAYLRALWLARGATVAALPADVRQDFVEHVR